MDCEYTKGPWYWDDTVPTEYREEFYDDNAPWLTISAPGGGPVIGGQIYVPNPSNLSLIAAAPELLEGCKDALRVLEAMGHKDTVCAIDLRTLISKAEGK